MNIQDQRKNNDVGENCKEIYQRLTELYIYIYIYAEEEEAIVIFSCYNVRY